MAKRDGEGDARHCSAEGSNNGGTHSSSSSSSSSGGDCVGVGGVGQTMGHTEEPQALLGRQMNDGGADILQKDARYFTISNVVCSFCGLKGHMSYDCVEEEEQQRCYLCGGKGHSSRECPDETCHLCKKAGHRARDCALKGVKRRVRRKCGPPRDLSMTCYVCGNDGHLDCSVERGGRGTLSCLNCGASGHNGANCNMPSADKMIPIVLEMERTRREQRVAARKKRKGGAGGGSDASASEGEGGESERFRERLMELAMQRRFKRS
eukprot:gb/GEZJ01003695.1/.p1 GENE.gb/GEZJ01003695.1/~~gb/GEZJ01003695.1/.p1  ORF type:complete len:265 (-),score=23.88 gb/GEZJ01003695.1/:803-1597(-)